MLAKEYQQTLAEEASFFTRSYLPSITNLSASIILLRQDFSTFCTSSFFNNDDQFKRSNRKDLYFCGVSYRWRFS